MDLSHAKNARLDKSKTIALKQLELAFELIRDTQIVSATDENIIQIANLIAVNYQSHAVNPSH